MDDIIKDLANRIISSIHDQLFKVFDFFKIENVMPLYCLLYTSPSPRD